MRAEDRAVDAAGSEGVEVRSAELKKPLGLWDLVVMQLLCVLSTQWLAVAAKAGSSHAALWIAAMLPCHCVIRLAPLASGHHYT